MSQPIGGAVLVSFFDSGHRVHTAFAHVLASGPADDKGNPSLTVAYPDPAAVQKLNSTKWYEGYKRVAGVLHVDHPDVLAGKASIAWGGTIASTDQLAGDGPQIPQPAGDGSRPYFKRQVPQDAPKVSREQITVSQAKDVPNAAPPADPAAETPGSVPDAAASAGATPSGGEAVPGAAPAGQ